MNGEYFIIQEGKATYLCRKGERKCVILAQQGHSGVWIKYREPQPWNWWKEAGSQPRYHPFHYFESSIGFVEGREPAKIIPKEEALAILLMGKNERTL